ncbi:hypothetical protein GOV05_03875 [Candidatus Woesearchaeota archaeon]|nr:hypothetical protein [Candidatus Woesearchaeota archaeon]
MINKKKGVLEAQFNWIFIVIVGVIIFLFFINVVNKQRETSDQSIINDLKNHLDSIVKGSAISVGTLYTINLPPKQALVKDCMVEDEVKFKDSRLDGIDMSQNSFFSPELLEGNDLITYSLYFKAPYIVSQFLYMTTDNVLFLLVENDDGSFASDLIYLYEKLPFKEEDYIKAIVTTAELIGSSNNNYYNIHIIFFNQVPESSYFYNIYQNEPRLVIYNIVDDGNGIIDFDGYNIIEKYDYDGTTVTLTGTTHTLDLASFMAVIFSDSIEEYVCGMKKALLRYQNINTIYTEKTRRLSSYVDNNPTIYHSECIDFLNDSIDYFEEIGNSLQIQIRNGNTDLSFFDTELKSTILNIKNNNLELGDLSCPVPY